MSAVLAINNYHFEKDGADTTYFAHGRLLEQNHWRVVPFAMQHARNEGSRWSSYFVEEIEYGHEYTWTQQISRVPKVLFSTEAQKQLNCLLDQLPMDVAHCFNVYHHLSPAILWTLKQRDIPTIMSLQDFKIACPAYHMHNQKLGLCEACKGGNTLHVIRHRCIKNSMALSTLVFTESLLHRLIGTYRNKVDRYVASSEFYVNKLVEWGWEPERFRHIPNFIDTAPVYPDTKAGRYFVYFDSLAPEKGLLPLIRAFAKVDAELRICSQGVIPEWLNTAIKNETPHNRATNIRLMPGLNRQHVDAQIRGARATILPSQFHESCPMSVLRSCALGKPVIASRLGGIPEIVLDGETGFLFDHSNNSELIAALEHALQLPDPQLRTMGESARTLVCERHSPARYLQAVAALYGELGVEWPQVA